MQSKTNRIFYVDFLRACAALLITNSHFNNIWPVSSIAFGGLLGDVLFFLLSAFCLSRKTDVGIGKWYLKRVVRIYPSVWIVSIFLCLIGYYSLREMNIFQTLIFPTQYHFIESIMLLYIPFYFMVHIDKLRKKIVPIFIGTVLLHIVTYILFVDKTTYNINAVRNPMIRFLFFEAMLMGLWFRDNAHKFENKGRIKGLLFTLITMAVYFVSTILIPRSSTLLYVQVVNQFLLIAAVFFLVKWCIGIGDLWNKLPSKIKGTFTLISSLTLEIYIVQNFFIASFSYLAFPRNLIVVLGFILAVSYAVNKTGAQISQGLNLCISKIPSRNKKSRKTLDS